MQQVVLVRQAARAVFPGPLVDVDRVLRAAAREDRGAAPSVCLEADRRAPLVLVVFSTSLKTLSQSLVIDVVAFPSNSKKPVSCTASSAGMKTRPAPRAIIRDNRIPQRLRPLSFGPTTLLDDLPMISPSHLETSDYVCLRRCRQVSGVDADR